MTRSLIGGRRGCKAPRSRCECGRRKREGAVSCSRCRELDGGTQAAMGIISALRVAGSLQTAAQIAEDADMQVAAVQRWITRHARSGRLVEVLPGQYALREDFRPSLVTLSKY
jgi:hypothetical protein